MPHSRLAVVVFALVGLATSVPHAIGATAADEAAGVIRRTFGEAALAHVRFESLQPAGDCDIYEYSAEKGELLVRGTSPVAIASGFYQFIRHHELGIASWTGNRLDLSTPWPDTPATRVSTPYALRYYFNVVTFGYTMPYWKWDRWQQEIDWMALHGINMPLSLNATEAIATRVWKQIGLTQPEIDEFYTGPGHLPWQRMGNMANVDGPLSDAWHAGQIALEHQILDRERALGMHPIAQGFSGFVPRGLQRVYPDIKLTQMKWSGFKEPIQRNNILSPDAPCFIDIGKRTVGEWEKEFGKCEYFLADSFNEMELPTKVPAEKDALLEHYGDILYRSVTGADPEATWVMQGWMFSYQPQIWTHDALASLLKEVPDDKMLILDEALDYSVSGSGKGDWDRYDGFFDKRWIAGFIPNMGGKSLYTGPIDFYASEIARILASPNRGRLSGMGIVPEGIENNEMLYELLADTIWRDKPIDVSEWLKNYVRSRYGTATPASVDEAFDLLHHGPYSSLISHPRFSWQLSPGKKRQTGDNTAWMPAAENLLAAAPQLQQNPLYQADVIELASLAAGGCAEKMLNRAIALGDVGDATARRSLANSALSLLTQIDGLLASHPTDRLDRWIAFAREQGTTDAEKDHYEANAKLLVTLWGHNGEISDYSSRVWSGLIAGYYVPRWKMYFDSLDGKTIDRRAWEKAWVEAPLPPTTRPADVNPIEAARKLLETAHADIAALPPAPAATQPAR